MKKPENQWPLKILLAHPKAEFMQDKKLTLAADCTLLIHKELAEKFRKESILIGCPMLEDPKRVFEKIKSIVKDGNAGEIEIFTMEVPCCHALHLMVDKAVGERDIEINKHIVRVSGEIEPYSGKIDESMKEAEAKIHACRCNHERH